DLIEQPQLHLAVALAAELGVEVPRPQALVLHLLLQRFHRARELLLGQPKNLERVDLVLHERERPVQLRLVFRLDREVVAHELTFLKIGSATISSSRCSSRNATCTGMLQRTSSGATPSTFDVIRTPSSSSTIATTYGTRSLNGGRSF